MERLGDFAGRHLVRRPPRGVLKTDFAKRDFYDVWLPELSPSSELVKKALAANSEAEWLRFERGYRAEMKHLNATRWLTVLSALSHNTAMSMGCYCEREERCHRSILKTLLLEHQAQVI